MAKANTRKTGPVTRKKVPAMRMPQRSEMIAGKEDAEGVQPIPAAKAKTPLPAPKRSRKTARR